MMNPPREEDAADTAASMADAVTWLSREAAAAGFHAVVGDLLTVRDKLEAIAAEERRQDSSKH